jgi:hypothetical protein
MRRFGTAAAMSLLIGGPLLGGTPKECLDLGVSRDSDVSSSGGVQVTVTGYNRCEESVEGRRAWFRVTAFGSGNIALGSGAGRFQTTITPHERGETKLFVQCDPDRLRSLKVEAE